MNGSDSRVRHRLEIYHLAVALIAFGLGAATAVMQALARADVELPMRSEKVYYLSVTAHGVLLALVFTTFFIMILPDDLVYGESWTVRIDLTSRESTQNQSTDSIEHTSQLQMGKQAIQSIRCFSDVLQKKDDIVKVWTMCRSKQSSDSGQIATQKNPFRLAWNEGDRV